MQADLQQPEELWGEDALLQWPGARRPLIQERDSYMARTIWAAASGTPSSLQIQDAGGDKTAETTLLGCA